MARNDSKKARKFPWYLPLPDPHALRWLGRRLKKARKQRKMTPEKIADVCQLAVERIKALERGEFHLPVGELRLIMKKGYDLNLLDVLQEYFEATASAETQREKPFVRDIYYRARPLVSRKKDEAEQKETEPKTPLFIGGDPKRYLWALPLRNLEKSSVVTEFLELAPARRLKAAGVTPPGAHDGEEIISVIHGRITVSIQYRDSSYAPDLNAGEAIHFDSTNRHLVRTVGNTPALLMVVRPK